MVVSVGLRGTSGIKELRSFPFRLRRSWLCPLCPRGIIRASFQRSFIRRLLYRITEPEELGNGKVRRWKPWIRLLWRSDLWKLWKRFFQPYPETKIALQWSKNWNTQIHTRSYSISYPTNYEGINFNHKLQDSNTDDSNKPELNLNKPDWWKTSDVIDESELKTARARARARDIHSTHEPELTLYLLQIFIEF